MPKRILKILDEYAERKGYYAYIVYFKEYKSVEENRYPTVLWNLETIGGLKLRSLHMLIEGL